jgi:hypothetical protein
MSLQRHRRAAAASARGAHQRLRPRLALDIRLAWATLVSPDSGTAMPELQAFHGHIVDLRRHTNVHIYHRRPFAPTDRYELWLRAADGTERKFTVNTRQLPARCGHEVSLILSPQRQPCVLALANWSTIDGINYARSEPLALVHGWDFAPLAAGFVGMTAWLGDAGMTLFVPAAAVAMAVAASVRWVARVHLAYRVDRALDLEAWRTAKAPVVPH